MTINDLDKELELLQNEHDHLIKNIKKACYCDDSLAISKYHARLRNNETKQKCLIDLYHKYFEGETYVSGNQE